LSSAKAERNLLKYCSNQKCPNLAGKPREIVVEKALYELQEEDLVHIHGGGNFTPYNGFGGGGTYTTNDGNSFSANPYQMSVSLNKQATNNLTTTLFILGAITVQNPGPAAGMSAIGSILFHSNQGNGITITQPTYLPIPFGMHASPRK
jgi:hypothetical protein